jgi:hypothetical protein
MDDFIVKSDEEDEGDDVEIIERPKRKKKHSSDDPLPSSASKKRKSLQVSESGDDSELSAIQESPRRQSKIGKANNKEKAKRLKVLDDSEESDGDDSGSEFIDHNVEQSDNDSDDEDELDDSTVYWRVNAAREEMEDNVENDVRAIMGFGRKVRTIFHFCGCEGYSITACMR